MAIGFDAPNPVLRIFDEAKAREFYIGYLGFQVDWEHRFEPTLPLYKHIAQRAAAGSQRPSWRWQPGHRDLPAHAWLTKRGYHPLRRGIVAQDWGKEMTITDPFGNRIRFCERDAHAVA
nr:glyoxalase superfamily protein [Rhodovarius lipocyclicus]